MRIAVVGCSHGTLDDIYASVERCDVEASKRGEPPIDLMICCGDFQAMRSLPDLSTMACPPKYRALGQFHNYYAERKKAPVLTIVIGGNHESSGYMWECYHGGWLAPDIYFLGYAGCLLIDGWLRIAGASGIWKGGDWKKGHYETVPYDDRTIRSVYHIREYDVARLLQLKNRGQHPDVFMSHDWPQGIEQHGDTAYLIREKPFFEEEIQRNSLGSPPLHALLTSLQPSYWFSAHLHVKFAALFHHSGAATVLKQRAKAALPMKMPPVPVAANPDEIDLDDEEEEFVPEGIHSEEKSGDCACSAPINPDEIDIGMEDEDEAPMLAQVAPQVVTPAAATRAVPATAADDARTTKFLALSKPGGYHDFLHIVDIPDPADFVRAAPTHVVPVAAESTPSTSTEPSTAKEQEPTTSDTAAPRYRPKLYFDPDWLAIVKTFAPYLSLRQASIPFPPPATFDTLIDESLVWVKENVGVQGMKPVDDVQIFARTAPASEEGNDDGPLSWYTNPQTEAFCDMIDIPNQINPVPIGFKEAQAQALVDVLAVQETPVVPTESATTEEVVPKMDVTVP